MWFTMKMSVSIHARHCWRANCARCQRCTATDSFNPRPSLLAGEPGMTIVVPVAILFQSTPVIAGGRTQMGMQPGVWRNVSIHARHCWRANRAMPRGSVHCGLFQSTPVIAGGRTSKWGCNQVSGVMFQSTPVIAGGRTCQRYCLFARCGAFQSTPVIAGGRTQNRRRHCNDKNRFQSTPVIAGGRTILI